jgi:hypothetical protein
MGCLGGHGFSRYRVDTAIGGSCSDRFSPNLSGPTEACARFVPTNLVESLVSPMKMWIPPIRTMEQCMTFSLRRNPALVVRDNGVVAVVEDAPDGYGVTDACEGRSRLNPSSRHRWPHGGSQVSLRIRW